MDERTTHLLDPASLKALAHPVRVRLLGLLRADGPATATGLASRLGESSGTTSYHLRQLATAGFVVEDVTRGNGRERWWRSAQDSTRLDIQELPDDPDVQAAADVFLSTVLDSYDRNSRTWLAGRHTWPKKWVAASTLSDLRMSLTAAELRRLHQQVEDLVESFRREPKAGDEQVVIQVQGFPVRTEE
jgi:DNA-binding transcriptional ArsR family regulator